MLKILNIKIENQEVAEVAEVAEVVIDWDSREYKKILIYLYKISLRKR